MYPGAQYKKIKKALGNRQNSVTYDIIPYNVHITSFAWLCGKKLLLIDVSFLDNWNYLVLFEIKIRLAYLSSRACPKCIRLNLRFAAYSAG